MPKIPKEKGLDSTLALLQEGYLFIKNRMDKYQTDLFETRLLGKKVICISGKEAAEIFYDEKRFIRKGAAPKRVQKTLTGEKAVQGMDGKAHMHRKALFLSLLDMSKSKEFAELVIKEWRNCIPRWEKSDRVVLFDEAKIILCKVACQWTGVPLSKEEIKNRAEDFASMIDAFGTFGPRHWKGKLARKRTEKWIEAIVKKVRANQLKVPVDSALYIIVNHKELNGKKLDDNMVAKEMINIIRPIVAISTYITFTALALNKYPAYKNKLLSGDNDELEMFVQEVRRYYPFTPFVGAKVKKDFIWKEYEFKKGTRVLLDIFGINHDFKIWENPYEFQPERFKNHQFDQFEFIPQGGGNPMGHRCPGEFMVVEVMKLILNFLINEITFTIPNQNLKFNMAKIPTFPKSGIIISNVKQKL